VQDDDVGRFDPLGIGGDVVQAPLDAVRGPDGAVRWVGYRSLC
jgi:hypothetical protein